MGSGNPVTRNFNFKDINRDIKKCYNVSIMRIRIEHPLKTCYALRGRIGQAKLYDNH